jgi:REP element-mobilizing transposase RayT
VTLGTLSKALGCAGGYVAGSQTLIDLLRNRARSLIYSTALPPAVCAAVAAAVDFVMSEEGHRRRDQLWRNVSELKHGLAALGIQNESRSAIIPVIIGDEAAAVEVSRKLYEAGLFVPAIRYPTVPKGKARLRVTVTAAHSSQDITHLLEVVGAVFNRDRRVLPQPVSRSRLETAPTSSIEFPRPWPHTSNLRKGRTSLPNECYFLTSCTEGRQPVFRSTEAAERVIKSLQWLRDEGRIRLLGFVVMPDHVHVAMALREDWTLAQVMQSFKRHTSRQIQQLAVGANSIRDHEHAVWQPGYYDTLLRDDRDFEARLVYMHENPVRKGLAREAQEFQFSTAHPDYAKEIDWAWVRGVTR